MGNWGPKVGVGSRVRGEEWIQPTYRIKISLRLVWPTQCFNGYEHININRLPSKAGFLDALKNRRSQTYIPTKYPSAGVECCLPSGEPTLYGHHSPTSSATTSTWHLCTTELLTPSIRHSAGCLAHGKLSGTGRPCLPPPKRKLQDQVTIFDLLSEPWGALPPYRGEVLLLFPPPPRLPNAKPFCFQLFSVDPGSGQMESWNPPEAVICQDWERWWREGEREEGNWAITFFFFKWICGSPNP